MELVEQILKEVCPKLEAKETPIQLTPELTEKLKENYEGSEMYKIMLVVVGAMSYEGKLLGEITEFLRQKGLEFDTYDPANGVLEVKYDNQEG